MVGKARRLTPQPQPIAVTITLKLVGKGLTVDTSTQLIAITITLNLGGNGSTVDIRRKPKKGGEKQSKIHMVDLAGSERVDQTGATGKQGWE